MQPLFIHRAPVVSGHGQGKKIGVPTINIDPTQFPKDVSQGIYACRAIFDEKSYDGALHFGPRPVFDDEAVSAEIHILDTVIDSAPKTLDLEIIGKVRDVMNFDSIEAMTTEIEKDIEKIRAMLRINEKTTKTPLS